MSDLLIIAIAILMAVSSFVLIALSGHAEFEGKMNKAISLSVIGYIFTLLVFILALVGLQ